MTQLSGEAEAATALELIKVAFADRAMPHEITDSKQLSDVEYAEVMSFEGKFWQDITFGHVEDCSDAVFWFSPEAFCYYLPGILSAGLRANRSESNAFDSFITCLDRSPEPDYWDDFFLPRWTRLTPKEIDAVAAWARWMEIVVPPIMNPYTYQRIQDTLALLKERAEPSAPHE